jgi:hypothetical protein
MGKYIILGPKEATAGVAAFAAQFESKMSLFRLSDWEVQDPLEQECGRSCPLIGHPKHLEQEVRNGFSTSAPRHLTYIEAD